MASTIDLGGPGAPCSISRLRRLQAGELPAEESARLAAHVAGCEKCRADERTLAAERAQLLREVPFEQFASGVAERLAAAEPRRLRWRKWAPLLAAACILVVAVPVAWQRRSATEQEWDGKKGGADLVQLYVKDARGVHAWQQGEGIPESADVHAELRAGVDDKFAAAVLLEGGEAHPLYAGLAHTLSGRPRVVSFGWTGKHDATLIVQLSAQPLDVQQMAASLRSGSELKAPRALSVRLPRAP